MNIALSIDLPVRLKRDRPMTDDEIADFCAKNEALRVEQDSSGELIVMSPAGGASSNKNERISRQLGNWSDETNLGLTFDSSGGFRLADGSLLNPDAAWLSWPRWNALSEEQQKRFLPVCPEFVIELRSESDRLELLREKMEQWIANGCELAWLIDRSRKAVEIYRPAQQPEIQEGHSAVYGEGPVAGFVLELGRIWA